MPRPKRCRRICKRPACSRFLPDNCGDYVPVNLTYDEFEVIRLVDLEKKTHGQCALQMDISRSTVTEIYEEARYKIAECLVKGSGLEISGGNYRLCDGSAAKCCRKTCDRLQTKHIIDINELSKGDKIMRIAVTYENERVFQHFGHTKQFQIYDIEGGKVIQKTLADAGESGHGALAGLLKSFQADVLICGGIGGGAQQALEQAGIKLYGGVTGSCDAAVDAFLKGELDYNPQVKCDHHGHEDHGDHQCGNHSCGEHK